MPSVSCRVCPFRLSSSQIGVQLYCLNIHIQQYIYSFSFFYMHSLFEAAPLYGHQSWMLWDLCPHKIWLKELPHFFHQKILQGEVCNPEDGPHQTMLAPWFQNPRTVRNWFLLFISYWSDLAAAAAACGILLQQPEWPKTVSQTWCHLGISEIWC